MAEALNTDPASLLMRDPTDRSAIWSIWDHASTDERAQIVDHANVVVSRKRA